MILEDLKSSNIEALKTNRELAGFCDTLYQECLRSTLKYHRDWYVYERFAKGHHWVVFNRTLNKIQNIPMDDGEVRRTVNKIRSQIRGIKNFIKRNQPRWEVHPDDVDEASFEDARKKNKIVQHVYDQNQIPQKLTGQITNALKFSLGIMEGAIVDEDSKQKIKFWIDDTFDIFFDPLAKDKESCRFIIKAIPRPITAIKTQFKKDVTPDNKSAASQYKEVLEREKVNGDIAKGIKDLETTLVKETFVKIIGSDGRPYIRIIKTADGNVLDIKDTKYRRYPLFTYNPELDPNAIYSDPWVKDMISLNKSLDKTVSQIETYVQRMNAGKYLIKQGVEVSMITDKGAEKVYYKGNVPPTPMPQPTAPTALFSHASSLERWIEEIGGMREASLGRVPGSLQSGKAVEALQAADAGTVAEPIENLEIMLAEVAEFILEVISDYQVVATEEIIQGKEKIKYIGASATGEIPEGTLKVGPAKVKVVIVPEIAYSEDSKKEWLMRLADSQLVDPQTVLEMFQFSNIAEIVERVKKNKEEQYRQEITKQREAHRTDGNGPQDTADLADQENTGIAAGQDVPLTPQALWTPEHTQLHMAFIQENQDAYQGAQQAFDEHIQNEQQYG